MQFNTKLPMRLRDAYASRHEPEAQRVIARATWALCAVIFFIALVASVVYGAWEFTRIPRGSDEGTVRAQTGFTRAQIETLLNTFDVRAEQFEARLRTPPAQDPS